MNRKLQHKQFAKVERLWKGQALADARYNLARSMEERHKGNIVLAKNYMQEYKWDIFWGKRRGSIIRREDKRSK